MKPLVSILIPAYNSAPWIAETIQSAANQTWENKEVIVVVDEGSTDQTLAVARQFASKTVSVVSRPHQGRPAARNAAYAISQGEYIQWLDADDLLASDKIQLQMQAAEAIASKRTLLSSEFGTFYYRPSKAKFHPTPLWCDLAPEEWLIRKLGGGDHMQPATWLAPRGVIEVAGHWNEQVRLDECGEFFCRLVMASDGIRFVPGSRVFYRMSGSGSSTLRTLAQNDARWHSLQLSFAHLRSLGDTQRVRTACLNYLQIWLIYFYPERADIVKQIERLAASVGGKLETPQLRWKFAWLKQILGYQAAKRAQFYFPQIKDSLMRSWDKAMFNFDRRSAS